MYAQTGLPVRHLIYSTHVCTVHAIPTVCINRYVSSPGLEYLKDLGVIQLLELLIGYTPMFSLVSGYWFIAVPGRPGTI